MLFSNLRIDDIDLAFLLHKGSVAGLKLAVSAKNFEFVAVPCRSALEIYHYAQCVT